MISVTKLREYQGHAQAIYTLTPSLRAGHFLSAGAEGIVAEWNVESGEGRSIVSATSPVYALCVLPAAGVLALGLRSGELAFVDLENGKMIRRVQLHKGAVFDIQPFPDGKSLLASGEDGALSVWNLERFDHIHYERLAHRSVRSIAFHAPSKRIAAAASDQRIYLLDGGLQPIQTWPAHENSVFRVLWSEDGERLFSTGRDAHIRTWSIGTQVLETAAVPAHIHAINDLIWHPGHQILLSGSMDKSIKLWQASDLKLLKVVNHAKNACHWNGVNRLLWLEGSLFSCGDDRRVMRWQFEWEQAAV